MCPSDKRPRLYVSGAATKREKKRRLDNAVAGTNPEVAGEYETSAIQEPVPEDEAAVELAPRGPVVQELLLTLSTIRRIALYFS